MDSEFWKAIQKQMDETMIILIIITSILKVPMEVAETSAVTMLS